MSKLEANPVLVKSDAPNGHENGLATMLRREGQELAKTQRPIQNTPLTPLQLHDSAQMVDPVLLPANAHVAILTDKHGQSAIAAAKARPHWNVSGWVSDTKTFMTLQTTETPENLHFDKRPQNLSPSNAVDAIIAVGWAHQLFSTANYHVTSLVKGIHELLGLLSENGQLLIQDFALQEDPEKFVTLEIMNPDAAQALIEFSGHARSHGPKAMQGFFIETLPSMSATIQRFHLPGKWAVEFYHRWRMNIAMDAPFELTTLSLDQWSALVEQCGARVTYRAPHFIPRKQAKEISRDIRFVDEQGKDLPLPASTFSLLIEKISDQTALHCYERRISTDKAQDILISGFKNKATDEKMDVVEVRNHEDDVLPCYLDADGNVHVLVRMNVSRPIINSVPRGTPNLDGRIWAGYLVEPLTITHLQGDLNTDFVREALIGEYHFPQDKFTDVLLTTEYYPAPDYLAQRVRGILVPLTEKITLTNPALSDGSRIVDVLADDVLRAISAGLIPDGKLEILIGSLMVEMGIVPRDVAPVGEPQDAMRATKITKDRREAKTARVAKSGEHMMEFLADTPTENLRAVRSVFVEDQMTDFGRQVSQYREQDFIVPNGLSANTAVCIPLMNDPLGGLMMSGEPRKLPIPQRMGSMEPLVQLPSFSLPLSVRNLDQARLFLAKQLGCDMDDLHVMGPSFFVQPQLSAERVYPFLLTAPPSAMMRARWFKPRAIGLQRGIDRHVDKTSAFVEYKFGRDTGEWYRGFSPEVANHNAKVTAVDTHSQSSAGQTSHTNPAAQLKLI